MYLLTSPKSVKKILCAVSLSLEIIRFDISVNEVSVVDVFDYAGHLVDERGHRFDVELVEGVLEE